MGIFKGMCSNWFQVIGNPIGCIIERKSADKEAQLYIASHKPFVGLKPEDLDEQTYEETKVNFINACGAALKSKDVSKTLANSLRNCEAAFNNDSTVISFYESMTAARAIEKEETKKKIALYGGIGIIVLFVLIFLIYAIK